MYVLSYPHVISVDRTYVRYQVFISWYVLSWLTLSTTYPLIPAHRALDSVNTALLVHSQYHYFLNNYGNPEAFKTPVWCVSLVSPQTD